MNNVQVKLFEQMLSVFNEEDVIELCFRMNIEYDDLNGKNRRAKIISPCCGYSRGGGFGDCAGAAPAFAGSAQGVCRQRRQGGGIVYGRL